MVILSYSPSQVPKGFILNSIVFFRFPLTTFSAAEQKWAFEEEQKYKVGKFVLEEVKIAKYHWESD